MEKKINIILTSDNEELSKGLVILESDLGISVFSGKGVGKENAQHGREELCQSPHNPYLFQNAHHSAPKRHHSDQGDRQRYCLIRAVHNGVSECFSPASDSSEHHRNKTNNSKNFS